MTLHRDWVFAMCVAILVVVAMICAIYGLAEYGGRPIVNNPRPAATKPLRINTLYIEGAGAVPAPSAAIRCPGGLHRDGKRCVPRRVLRVPAGGWGAADLRIAAEYWGTASPPNCASEQVYWEAPPAWHGEREAASTVAESPGTACEMWIGVHTDIYDQCLAVIHEYGHWMGLGWGTDPRSIMYDGSIIGSAEIGEPWKPPFIGRCGRLEEGYDHR